MSIVKEGQQLRFCKLPANVFFLNELCRQNERLNACVKVALG